MTTRCPGVTWFQPPAHDRVCTVCSKRFRLYESPSCTTLEAGAVDGVREGVGLNGSEARIDIGPGTHLYDDKHQQSRFCNWILGVIERSREFAPMSMGYKT